MSFDTIENLVIIFPLNEILPILGIVIENLFQVNPISKRCDHLISIKGETTSF